MSGAGHHEAGGFECQLHTHGLCRQQLKGRNERQGPGYFPEQPGPLLTLDLVLPACGPSHDDNRGVLLLSTGLSGH